MKQLLITALACLGILLSCKKDTTASSESPVYVPNVKIIDVDKYSKHINVMGNQMPAFPAFSALSKQPGKVRGYLKDWTGKPLVGAKVGVRTSYFAGYYSSVNTISDGNGYYELSPAQGTSEFYNTGFQISYGTGTAAVSFHPADGQLESWVTSDGQVENFVLLPYGITSYENLQNNPQLPSTFYGGAIYLGWYGAEVDDPNAPDFAIKEGTLIEITLTPEDNSLYGVAGQSFVIRKIAASYGELRLHNIPIGLYKIDIKANGRDLKMRNNRYYAPPYGLKPSEAIGHASLGLVHGNADPAMLMPGLGNWDWVDIYLESQ